MITNTQEQIDSLKAQLAEYQAASPVNVDKVNAIINRIAELEMELAQSQQEKDEREQRKQETIETTTSVDVLQQIFGTLLPADKFEVILGPNKYDTLNQDFKAIIQQYITESLQTAYDQHELEIAQKDEKIRLLNDQSLSVQLQLDEANKTIHGLKEDALIQAENYQDLIDDQKKVNRQLLDERDEAVRTVTEADKTIADLRAAVSDLQSKLLSAQKPKAEAQPSQKLDDMLNAIKSKNDTADDWLARWNARQKSEETKIPLPEVNPPQITESPFRNESDSQTQPSSDQLPSAEASENMTQEASFPTAPPSLPTDSTNGTVASETVTKAELEARLAQFAQEYRLVKGEVA